MKLSKKLLLASLIACSLSVTAQASSSEELSGVASSINTHDAFLKNVPERLRKGVEGAAGRYSKALIEEAIRKAREASTLPNLTDVKVQADKLVKILTEHAKGIQEIAKKSEQSDMPKSVLAKEIADVNKGIHDKLKKEIAQLLPTYSTETDPFLAYLLKESTDATAAAEAYSRAESIRNSVDINQLKLNVEQNRKDISELRREHRKAIAQVAAMSSIDFGNVKARTIKVGAALGHYRDHTAIAVGAAVAPNDNWLINTKVATSTKSSKDVTFGLGATYEFSY